MKQEQTSTLLKNIKKLMKLGSKLDDIAAEYPDFCYVMLSSEQISHVTTICNYQLYLYKLVNNIDEKHSYEYLKKTIKGLALAKARIFVELKHIETTESMIKNNAALKIIDEANQVIQLSLDTFDKILETLQTDMQSEKSPSDEKTGI